MLAGGFVEAALEIVGGDGLDGVVEGEFDDEWLCGSERQRVLRDRDRRGAIRSVRSGFEEVPHWKVCPRAWRAWRMPWAAESLGSSWRALLTFEAEASVWLACRSRRARTR